MRKMIGRILWGWIWDDTLHPLVSFSSYISTIEARISYLEDNISSLGRRINALQQPQATLWKARRVTKGRDGSGAKL